MVLAGSATERIAQRLRGALRWLPLACALVLVPLAIWVAWASTFNTLGRDQGIFQYIAWAVLRGAKDYRDVRDVNGPLTHLVHMVLLALGGRDEHRFRVLD